MNIVSDNLPQVFERISGEIEKRGDALASIIKGKDDLWDVSIMKFIYDITRRSIQDNVNQFGAKGLLKIDRQGVPGEARLRIEQLFDKVEAGRRTEDAEKKSLTAGASFRNTRTDFSGCFGKK